MVDYSSACSPKTGADSIHLCHGGCDRGSGYSLHNPSTRAEAQSLVKQLLADAVSREQRVLICFDFPYNYPAGFDHLCGSTGRAAGWRATWDKIASLVVDDDGNRNNRFAAAAALNSATGGFGPFWGCPVGDQSIRRTKPVFPMTGPSLAEYRLVEARLRARGKMAFSAWQLYGAGSVGGQMLVGIPRLLDLLRDPVLAPHSVVWPFQTGWTIPSKRPSIVHAEIWPGAVEVDTSLHSVKDAAQVISLTKKAVSENASGDLVGAFRRPEGLTDQQESLVRAVEGWVLWA